MENSKFKIQKSVEDLDRDLVVPIDRARKPDCHDLRHSRPDSIEGMAANGLHLSALAPAGDFEPQLEGADLASASVDGFDLHHDLSLIHI